jgi:excisionase family DNA binding protein
MLTTSQVVPATTMRHGNFGAPATRGRTKSVSFVFAEEQAVFQARFDVDEGRRFGDASRTARVAARERQADLGARCVPPISAQRLSLIERGRAMRRPSETTALLRALPGLASELDARSGADALRRRRPAVVKPVPPTDWEPRVLRATRMASLPDLLRVSEASVYCDVGNGAIYGAIEAGKLEAVRVGRLIRVTRDSLQRFLAGQAGDSPCSTRRAHQ